MVKITHKINHLELIDHINNFIHKPGSVDFHQVSVDKHRKALLAIIESKFIGLGFSFIEMLVYFQRTPSIHKDHTRRILKKLNYDLDSESKKDLDEKTTFAIQCYFKLVPFEKLKSEYEKHYCDFQKYTNKELPRDIKNASKVKNEVARQFMTPLTSAMYARNVEMIRFILSSHKEWLETKYIIGEDSENGILVFAINPILIASKDLKCKWMIDMFKPHLQAEVAANYIMSSKTEININFHNKNNVKPIIILNSIESSDAHTVRDWSFSNYNISGLGLKLSVDDYLFMLQATLELGDKSSFRDLLKEYVSKQIKENSETNRIWPVEIMLSAAKVFSDLEILNLILENLSVEKIIGFSQYIQNIILDFSTKKSETLKSHPHHFGLTYEYNLLLEKLTSNEQLLKTLGVLELVIKLIRLYLTYSFRNASNPICIKAPSSLIRYAAKAQDKELIECIIKSGIHTNQVFSSDDVQIMFQTLPFPEALKPIQEAWEMQYNFATRINNKVLLPTIISFISKQNSNWIEVLTLLAIQYERMDCFIALKEQEISFNVQAVVETLFKSANRTWECYQLLLYLIDHYETSLAVAKFPENTNLLHLVAKHPPLTHILPTPPHSDPIAKFIKNHANLLLMADGVGRTPLHHAAKRGNTNFVRLITDFSTIDFEDNVGFTALNYAYIYDSTEIKTLLLSHGAADDCGRPQKQQKMRDYYAMLPDVKDRKPLYLKPELAREENNKDPISRQDAKAIMEQLVPQIPPQMQLANNNPPAQQNAAPEVAFHNIPNNTHMSSINQSVATSIKSLMGHYGDPSTEIIKTSFNAIKDYILEKIAVVRLNTDLHIEKFVSEMHKLLAMDRYIRDVENQFKLHLIDPKHYAGHIIKEEITQIPLFKVLVLVWQAGNDMDPKVNTSDTPLTDKDKNARLEIILDRFRRNIRGGNIHEKTGVDNLITDYPICGSGQVNNLTEALEGVHLLITIMRGDSSVKAHFSEEAHKLAYEFFKNYHIEPHELLKLLNKESPNEEEGLSIKKFREGAYTHVANELKPNVITSENKNALLSVKTLNEILDNLMYVDYEKNYFTDFVNKLAQDYFNDYKNIQKELLMLFRKKIDLLESEERLVKRYYHDLRNHILESLDGYLATGALSQTTLKALLNNLEMIQYRYESNDNNDGNILGKRKNEGKEEAEENNNQSVLANAGFFKKRRQEDSDDAELDQLALEIAAELEKQEKTSSDSMELN